jgi:hypothetical protein
MNGNSLGVVVSPEGSAVAERSEGERSEPQRSAATAKAGADRVSGSRPDPEVVAKPKRRTYTAVGKKMASEGTGRNRTIFSMRARSSAG